MKALFDRFVGTTIGINLEKAHHAERAELVAAEVGFFTVRSAADDHLHHVPYANVIQVIENLDGIRVRHLFTADEVFPLIVKVGHVVTATPP